MISSVSRCGARPVRARMAAHIDQAVWQNVIAPRTCSRQPPHLAARESCGVAAGPVPGHAGPVPAIWPELSATGMNSAGEIHPSSGLLPAVPSRSSTWTTRRSCRDTCVWYCGWIWPSRRASGQFAFDPGLAGASPAQRKAEIESAHTPPRPRSALASGKCEIRIEPERLPRIRRDHRHAYAGNQCLPCRRRDRRVWRWPLRRAFLRAPSQLRDRSIQGYEGHEFVPLPYAEEDRFCSINRHIRRAEAAQCRCTTLLEQRVARRIARACR